MSFRSSFRDHFLDRAPRRRGCLFFTTTNVTRKARIYAPVVLINAGRMVRVSETSRGKRKFSPTKIKRLSRLRDSIDVEYKKLPLAYLFRPWFPLSPELDTFLNFPKNRGCWIFFSKDPSNAKILPFKDLGFVKSMALLCPPPSRLNLADNLRPSFAKSILLSPPSYHLNLTDCVVMQPV